MRGWGEGDGAHQSLCGGACWGMVLPALPWAVPAACCSLQTKEGCSLPGWSSLCPRCPGVSLDPWKCFRCLAAAVRTAGEQRCLCVAARGGVQGGFCRVEALMGPVRDRDEAQLPRSICYVCLKLMEHRGFMEMNGAGKGLGFAE